MKKAVVRLLSLVFILSIIVVPVVASGEDQTIEENGFVCVRLIDGALKLVQYTGNEKTVYIPSTIKGSHIEQIGSYAFDECRMTSVTIPDTVKVIETFAFNNCTNIQKVTIPNEVLFISGNPFTGCTGLVNISVAPNHPTLQTTSDGVLYSKRNRMLLCYPCSKTDSAYRIKAETLTIGDYAFFGCELLRSIVLPETVTGIREGAFLNCKNLVDVSLPDSLLSIGELAFGGCTSLLSVRIPREVSRIELSTFFNCASLAEASFPDNLITISDRAFYGCQKLQEVHLPTNLTTIGDNAFDGCQSLTDVYIPTSVTTIGENAFNNCSIRLYLHLEEYAFAEIYAKLYDISYRYGNEDSFLSSGND